MAATAAPPRLSASTGLTELAAAARRARGLGNTLPPPTGRTYARIVRENVLTFVNAVIFALGLALVLLGEWGDALISSGVVSINVLVGLVQEVRAKRTLDRIALLARPRATVVRDGAERAVDPAEIVLGDVLVLRRGDTVVVDGVVLEAVALEVDESLLTGESEPAAKRAGDAVSSGSACVAGAARYAATAVGEDALANRLTRGARAFRRVATPLQRHVDLVLRAVLVVALSYGALLVVATVLSEIPLVESVRMGIVIAGLVPNGLFVAMATAYALGAVRIAGRGVLVQQANAVESLSHVDVLCLDKTGTLTTGRLALDVARPCGADEARLRDLLGAYAASAPDRDRTTTALAAAFPGRPATPLAAVPFSPDRRWSALALQPARALYLGAPEALAPRLNDAGAVRAETDALAAHGLRVLLLCEGAPFDPDRAALPERLVALGAVALREELRPGVREIVEQFAAAGIRLVLISGDHPATVRALARAAGVAVAGDALSGADVAGLDEAALGALAERVTVFGRTGPREKERLVAALHARGHHVAMVGDGVNDVLALKRADLAVSLGGASSAARAVADLVLLDDTFAALPTVFREGQRILHGMTTILRLFLTRVLSAALLIAAVAVVGAGFPLTPRQNALLTLLGVGIPMIAIAAWARPRRVDLRALLPSLARFVVPAGWSLAALGLAAYLLTFATDGPDAARSTLASVAVLCGVLLVPLAERGGAGRADPRALGLAALLGVAYTALLFSPLAAGFDLVAPAPVDYALLAAAAVAWALAIRLAWRVRMLDRLLGLAR